MEPRQAMFVSADEPHVRARASAIFRPILAIPHVIALYLFGIVAAVCVVGAWFAIVFTGRFPTGLYNVLTKYNRYSTAVTGYIYLLYDKFPPFFSPDPGTEFDADLRMPPPMASYSRAKTAFRILWMLPIAALSYGLGLLVGMGAVLSWLSIMFTGRQSPRFREAVLVGLSYQARLGAYSSLQTEDWPSLLEAHARVVMPDRTVPAGATTPSAVPPPPPSPPVSPPPPPGYRS